MHDLANNFPGAVPRDEMKLRVSWRAAAIAVAFLASAVAAFALARRVEGLEAPAAAIINGTESRWSTVPYYCAVKKAATSQNPGSAGGVLISPTCVITAAHVASDTRPRDFEVLTYPGVVSKVAAVHVHPQYTRKGLKNDVALLRLAKPVTASTIKIADRPTPVHTLVMVAGRGKTSRDQAAVVDIFKAPLNVINMVVKPSADPGVLLFQSTSQNVNNLKRPCYGDSGGPVVNMTGNKRELVSINSAVNGGCSAERTPDGKLYTYPLYGPDLVAYRPWIARVMAQMEKDAWCGGLYGSTAFWKADKQACVRPATRIVSGQGGPVKQVYLQTCTRKGCSG